MTTVLPVNLLPPAAGAVEAFRHFPFTPRQFLMFWFVSLAWVLATAVVRALRRRREGKPFFPPKLPDTRFYEGWTSGRSRRSLLTRLGGANKCLWVMIAGDELRVSVHFPFNVFLPPGKNGLDDCIKGRDVLGVEERLTFSGRPCVRLRIRGPNGTEEELELELRNPEGFRRALAEIGAPIPATGQAPPPLRQG